MSKLHPNAREALLEATIVELAHSGATALNVRHLCDRLHIPASLVNYHFGHRDRLIAEATVTSYERYSESNVRAVEAAWPDPEAQVKAWVHSQLGWTIRNPGIAAILNYSLVSPGIGTILNSEHLDRLSRAGTHNLRAIASAVRDLRTGRVDSSFDTAEFLLDDELAATISHVMWTTLGFSTWAAGHHAPSRTVEAHMTEHRIIDRVVDQLLAIARGGREATSS